MLKSCMLFAHAKINLILAVDAQVSDTGYHYVDSIFHPLDLADIVQVTEGEFIGKAARSAHMQELKQHHRDACDAKVVYEEKSEEKKSDSCKSRSGHHGDTSDYGDVLDYSCILDDSDGSDVNDVLDYNVASDHGDVSDCNVTSDYGNISDYRDVSNSSVYTDSKISIDMSWDPLLPAVEVSAENNIAYKAAQLFMNAFSKRTSLHIRIHKKIPAQAGLAGGSTDAAAVLRALCNMYDISPRSHQIMHIAQQLGADVACFLYDSPVHMTGFGDVLVEQLHPLYGELVLIKPQAGVSTPQAFMNFDQDPQDKTEIEPLCAQMRRNMHATDAREMYVDQDACNAYELRHLMGNNLSKSAYALCAPMVSVHELAKALIQQEALDVAEALISGSGSTIAYFCKDQDAACQFEALLRQGASLCSELTDIWICRTKLCQQAHAFASGD